jgi:diadenosine tetraphosphatase ApaH/serine/threonine PP2A family protein phosphatase
MLIALFSDIHGNKEAFAACLADAKARGADQYVFLGDYVGYGAEPEWVVETLDTYLANRAIAVVGNHDRAISDPSLSMNATARAAIDWTRQILSAKARTLLDRLPLSVEDQGRLFVHADAAQPGRWNYIVDSETAWSSLDATKAQITFCGHVHVPAVYGVTATAKLARFMPVPGVGIPLLRQRRWLCVLGSVGQPRDGNPAACYGLFNTETSEMSYLRVPYDVEGAAARIRAAGLPDSLADRLLRGR